MSSSSFAVHRFKEIASTNDWLLSAARGGADDRTVVVADHQLRGRGRLDRTWEAPAGTSLLASVLLRPALEPQQRYLCSVALALGALEALSAVASLRAGLKWPNDLVVGDRKLGGILAEVDGTGPGAAVVAGIGINLTFDGPEGANGTSVLRETGRHVERDELLDSILAGLAVHLGELERDGASTLLDAYRLRLTTLGRRVAVELGQETLHGVATDVSESGHLCVEIDGTVREFAAGDVVHLRSDEG